MFCGHPSLRFGDVIHFIELWGSSPNNAVVFTGNPIRMASGPEGEVPLPPFALTIGQFVEGMYPKGYNFLSPTLLSLSSLS